MPPLIHAFKVHDKAYVFDANVNAILPVDDNTWHYARLVEDGEESGEDSAVFRRFNAQGYFLSPDIHEIKHPDTDLLEYHLSRKIQMLTLQVTQNCNLRCDYCIYSGKYETRQHDKKNMSFETAKKAIDYVLMHSIESENLSIGFYGGEPLLEIGFLECCIAYILAKGKNRKILFSVTTNGTLLTSEVYERLTRSNISISISLDGPKPIHDSARKYHDGRGSFDDIMSNILCIQEKYPDAKEKLRIIAVASPNIDCACVNNLYTMDEILPDYDITMNFVSEQYTDTPIVYSEELSSRHKQERAKLLLYMLGRIEKDKVSRMVIGNVSSILRKYELLRHAKKLPQVLHPGGPCLAGVARLFVSADGFYYPCERVSETSDVVKIGDVEKGLDVSKAKAIMNIGKTTEEECKKCWAVMHCTLCVVTADNQFEYSGSKRLAGCSDVKQMVEDYLMTICFLKTHGCDFDVSHN